MRQVAKELRSTFIAPHHLGPLEPVARAHEAQEVVERLERTRAPAEPHHGPDVAQLVGGERVPGLRPVAALAEKRPVALEGGGERAGRQDVAGLGRREGDRGRGGVEIAQVRAARHVVDLVRGHRRRDRGAEVAREAVAERAQPHRLIGVTQLAGEPGGVLEAAQGEEVVPVGVHGLGGVALVTDRGRQDAEERLLPRRAPLGAQALVAQRIQVGDRLAHTRPQAPGERQVAGVARVFGDQEDELTAAVVLGHRVRPARVHAAGHLAIVVLIGREPFDELTHRLGPAESHQRR